MYIACVCVCVCVCVCMCVCVCVCVCVCYSTSHFSSKWLCYKITYMLSGIRWSQRLCWNDCMAWNTSERANLLFRSRLPGLTHNHFSFSMYSEAPVVTTSGSRSCSDQSYSASSTAKTLATHVTKLTWGGVHVMRMHNILVCITRWGFCIHSTHVWCVWYWSLFPLNGALHSSSLCLCSRVHVARAGSSINLVGDEH